MLRLTVPWSSFVSIAASLCILFTTAYASDGNSWEILPPDTSGFISSVKATGGVISMGTPGTSSGYNLNHIDLDDGTDIEVSGNVILYLADGMSISGASTLRILADSSLTVYTPKNITLSAGALINLTNEPANCIFYGTAQKEGEQGVTISGLGVIEAAIHAPSAEVILSGQAGFFGAIESCELTLSGQSWYTFDNDLSETFPFGTPENWNPFEGLSVAHDTIDTVDQFSLSWESVHPATYQIEHTAELGQPFTPISGAKFTGTGDLMTWTDDENASSPKGYYRIRVCSLP